MVGLYDYMTESEKELAIYSRLTENRLNHIGLEIDKLMLEHAEHISACELKVLMESGDASDLETFYATEAEEVKEKSKGLIARLFAAIGAFVTKIKEALFGKSEAVKEENLPDKIELQEDPRKVTKEGNMIINGIKNFFSNNKEALKKLGIGTAIAATAGATVYELNKHDAIPVLKDLKDFINATDKEVRESQKKAADMDSSGEDATELKKATSGLQRQLSKAQHIFNSIIAAAGGDEEFKKIQGQNAADRAQKKQEKEDKKLQAVNDAVTAHEEASTKNAADQEATRKEIKDLEAQIANTKKQINADVKKNGGMKGFESLFTNFDKLYNEYRELAAKNRSAEENKRLNKITGIFDKAGIGSKVKSMKDAEVKILQAKRKLSGLQNENAKNTKGTEKAKAKQAKYQAKQNATKY